MGHVYLILAQKACNRIAVIEDGVIGEEGPTAEVFANPQSPVTRELLAYDNLTSAPNEDYLDPADPAAGPADPQKAEV